MVFIYKKRKKRRFVIDCIISVRRTNNNLFVVVANLSHSILKNFSSGKIGFKNSKKDTPYAFESVGKAVSLFLFQRKFYSFFIKFFSPVDRKIKSFMKGLFKQSLGKPEFKIKFFNRRAVAHNGCRPKRLRRV